MEKPYRILVIDSDTSFTETAKDALAGTYEVSYAFSEEAAREKIKAQAPDLIVLGYLEPRGASRRLATTLAKEPDTVHLPILVVDVRPEEFSRRGWRLGDGFSPNVKDYIWRPVAPAELRENADRIIQRARAGPMNLSEIAAQTEEMLLRIDRIRKLLKSAE